MALVCARPLGPMGLLPAVSSSTVWRGATAGVRRHKPAASALQDGRTNNRWCVLAAKTRTAASSTSRTTLWMHSSRALVPEGVVANWQHAECPVGVGHVGRDGSDQFPQSECALLPAAPPRARHCGRAAAGWKYCRSQDGWRKKHQIKV